MIELALVNAPETLIRELKQQSIGLPAPASVLLEQISPRYVRQHYDIAGFISRLVVLVEEAGTLDIAAASAFRFSDRLAAN